MCMNFGVGAAEDRDEDAVNRQSDLCWASIDIDMQNRERLKTCCIYT